MSTTTVVGAVTTREIPLNQIICDPCDNYRWGSQEAMERDLLREESHIQKMATSIATAGLINPIGVKIHGKHYKVIYGFNRFQAATLARISMIRAQVYPKDTSAASVGAMQVTENNDDLRRSVGWVREMEHYVRLHKDVEAEILRLPSDQRTRTAAGNMMSSRVAAWMRIGELVGRSYMTLQERTAVLRCLHPSVADAARDNEWSYSATVEFYSGDASKPYGDKFVTEVLKELRRNFPRLHAREITPTKIREAKNNVAAWIAQGRGRNGKPLWVAPGHGTNVARMAAIPLPAVSPQGFKVLTVPALRVIAQNLMYDALKGMKLSPTLPDKVWADLATSPAAIRVSGIGIATGDILLSDDAADTDATLHIPDFEQRASFFLTQTIVSAALRHFVSQRYTWRDWVVRFTVTNVSRGHQRSNHFLFQQAVRDGMATGGGIRQSVIRAWAALGELGAIHGA